MTLTTKILIEYSIKTYLQDHIGTNKTETPKYYGYLYASSEQIANEIMELSCDYIPNEVNSIQYKRLISFSSTNNDSLKYFLSFIENIINHSNEILIKEMRIGWLQDFLKNKDLLGCQVLQTQFGLPCNNINDAVERLKTKNKDDLERSTYLLEVNQMNKAVSNRDFDHEFQYIIEYMLAAFNGHDEGDIINTLLQIKSILINDLKSQEVCFAKPNAAYEERSAILDYISYHCEHQTRGSTWSYLDTSTHNEFNTVDIHEYWNKMLITVSRILKSNLPMLKVNHLDELLEDESSKIPPSPEFKGLNLDSHGFAYRVAPQNLRYDQQEQGNSWRRVLSGAIVAHYHLFIQIKQSESVKQQIISFSNSLVITPNPDLDAKIIQIYKTAQRITQ